jgi:exopolyphosphatase/guanosine-5'-triphosphate,3'-diphosphate pyrophosphatase
MSTTRSVAAVDLGSNSFHMMVARVEGDELQVIDRLREPVRLATGLDEKNRLIPAAIDRATECLERFGQRLRDLPKSRVRAVGTNTLRKARNSAEFMRQAEKALGHPIEIVSGLEEARLIYGGVAKGLGPERPRRLVIDIGGGSTELIVGNLNQPRLMESRQLGCIVHTRRHFSDGDLTNKAWKAAELAVRVELENLQRPFLEAGWDAVVGASGSIRSIQRVIQEHGWSELYITREGLGRLIDKVLEAGSIDKLDLPGLSKDRRPIFAGGLVVLQGIFKSLDIEQMEVSDYALRDGLLLDLLGRLTNRDIRPRTVAAMATRYGADSKQADRVEATGLRLLEQVAEDWKLDAEVGARMLGWASQLHEVGLAISHAQYQRHTAYLVGNTDLAGFSQVEQQALAVLLRLHRGKYDEDVLESLPEPWSDLIARLVALFRLAVLLHRSRSPEPLPAFKVRAEKKSIELEFPKNWLDQHPLTRGDLDEEADELRDAGLKLRFD